MATSAPEPSPVVYHLQTEVRAQPRRSYDRGSCGSKCLLSAWQGVLANIAGRAQTHKYVSVEVRVPRTR